MQVGTRVIVAHEGGHSLATLADGPVKAGGAWAWVRLDGDTEDIEVPWAKVMIP